VAEAAERLLAFVREIRELDAQHEQINLRKAALYREVKTTGFNKKAVKEVASESSLDDDTKALRQYLTLLCGPEAAASMETRAISARYYSGRTIVGRPNMLIRSTV
jgi:uncharacterized protein (UPF0335 family)